MPLGVADELRGSAPAERPAGEGYVLFVGTPEPRKNLTAAGRRGRAARACGSWSPAPAAGATAARRRASSGSAASTTRPCTRLYAGAACLAIPSLDEGFGLPAVEAMAVGCPVVAARAGALPEICGDAAVLVDPLDTESIAAGLLEAVARADELRERGRARAALYTWERSAELLVSAWQSLT